ncbi:MAG: tRNA uridine-5-carboxymethylaminomethyl(34) synthesis GTPase MnmE [Candidatus Aminicenantes bacterium RBG_16_63_16]|nr:MAG: tRNA uridine-5-carboxymethylaminomethyl(34) synthesis GTPase MnmE [Candidatus Aminicenantes bacterium RBG_16_63_16]
MDDTIIAISTPPGWGGLGIIRLSGKEALPIARKIFRPGNIKSGVIRPRTAIYGEIIDSEKGEPLDEAFLTFWAAPKSYTGEDVVELSCHGSPVVLEETVRLGVRAGARLAGPGEFTLRAYMNGRLDILQAEAVNDLITAATLSQARISARQLRGGLSRRVDDFRRKIVAAASLLEAAIEFPEEETGLTGGGIQDGLLAAIAAVDALASTYELGRAMSEGISLAIVGRANVGKSTLFNALLDRDRAIISPHPGTTRDYLREKLLVGDAVFQLTDMAGLETAAHPVEKEGIRRGEAIASSADGILFILDASRPETPADLRLLKRFRGRKAIVVFNKSDLTRRIDRPACANARPAAPWVEVSALKGTHVDRLKALIGTTFVPDRRAGEEVVLHQRQELLLSEISEALGAGLELLREGHSEELCAEEVRRALRLVGQLTGEVRADEVIQGIFSRFCVGK